jgi:hypothetical protein
LALRVYIALLISTRSYVSVAARIEREEEVFLEK